MPRAPKKPKTPMYQQPAQRDVDGAVSVCRPQSDTICIEVATNGVTESITMGGYNAWRIFGMLSVMLGLPLSKAVAESIQLKVGNVQVETPAPTLGDKISRYLYHQELLKMQEAGTLPPGVTITKKPKKDDDET